MEQSVSWMRAASRRAVMTALAVSVVGSGVVAAPAAGESPTKVPKVVQIKDPAGDANFVNNQTGPGEERNDVTPADLSVPDILSAWFTHDAKTISVHIQTEAPPPGSESAYRFAVTVNPESPELCLYLEAFIPGPTWAGGDSSSRVMPCYPNGKVPDEGRVPGELAIHESADGTGITSMTFPRWAGRAFADGGVLESPSARTQVVTGAKNGGLEGSFLTAYVDRTSFGKTYSVTKR